MSIFETLESEVRSYCRNFDAVFTNAQGSHIFDEEQNRYIDFFSGAGVLNYGHNHPVLKAALIEYLQADGILHGLDMSTETKREFLETFEHVILKPRNLDYKLQFPGPTGTNAVEAALKLARKVTGRHNIVSFSNGYHGMTLGSLALTGNSFAREGGGVPLPHSPKMPFDGYFGDDVDTLEYFERFLADPGSGLDRPAAVIVETVQGEGGINVARMAWLRRLAKLCRAYEILLIIDDIQAGCGRTGPFFSFSPASIEPDIVLLSKSLSGYGLPFSLTLFRRELDHWKPGEHNGTFRGHNLAFVTATAALNHFWKDLDLAESVQQKGQLVKTALNEISEQYGDEDFTVRGRGLFFGLDCSQEGIAGEIAKEAFRKGLIMETSGPTGNVAKVMPPLTIEKKTLQEGLEILASSVSTVVEQNALMNQPRRQAGGAS